jgi:AcrR family transcriptional regulator
MGSDSHNSAPGGPAGTRAARSVTSTGTPARSRELRAQGRKTMRRLSDAGMRVFAARGYHQSRVDDIVRSARTSHGTFYLYFANKEDLLRSLAVDCAGEMEQLADRIGPIDDTESGLAALREFLVGFVGTYRRYGVVIRAWMEDQVSDREVDRLGVQAFTRIATTLASRMEASGGAPAVDTATSVAALMALLERFSYAVASRDLGFDDDEMLTSLALVVHRGFFAAG